VLGHGYQAFWNFSRIESFSHTFEWTIPNGHSSYLDGLLDLGIVGMALCALTMFNGVRESVRHLRTRREIGLGFIFVMLVAQSFNSIAESGLATPTSFVFFLTVWGLLRLGFVRQPTEAFVAVQVPTMAYS
jgi:O-antigen ligase